MNRIVFPRLFKSALAFLIVLSQLPVFATDYYSINSGIFNDPAIWTTTPLTNKPATKVIYNDGGNSFTIQDGHQVRITSDLAISILDLTLQGSGRIISRLIIESKVTSMEINGTLKITSGAITCGSESVNLTVNGDLEGDANSGIQHSPDLRQVQTLTLNGKNNKLGQYATNAATLDAGISQVVYSAKGSQYIFPSSNYSILKVSGGVKALLGNIQVNNQLDITKTTIQLSTFDLKYAGTEAQLNISGGWVNTNGSGYFYNININDNDQTKTFPVGDAVSMQKITLYGKGVAVVETGIRFDPRKGASIVGDGMQAWSITSLKPITLDASIQPNPADPELITTKSKIALYNENDVNPAWHVEPTSYSNLTGAYSSSSFSINYGISWLMLYNCPSYTISHPSPLLGYVGEPFSEQFLVNNDPLYNPDITINSSPSSFKFYDGKLEGTPKIKTVVTFTLSYSDAASCGVDTSFALKIIERLSPNLSMATIDAKTFGEDSFQVRTFSRSAGKITYSVSSTGTGICAFINDTTGFVKITCGGPFPNNQITVTATQAADGAYRGESVSKSFTINPAAGRLYVKNFAFLANKAAPIKVATKSTGAISFDQLSGLDVATVNDITGSVSPILQSGEFKVRISLAATDNYTAFDSVYTFRVYTLNKPPVAIGDTITLEMGTDTTFNILQNDRGQTGEIIPDKTDIDIENSGVQFRYYATELGNFIIDTAGNLTVRPFYGFIGSGRMGYKVTDLNGLTSEVAYVEVTVKAPYVTPELKANDVMTPNNDNLNDALVIGNTDLSKENSLIIIDVAGNTVYESTNYQNNWEGTDKKGNKLEPGTYFYTFKEKTSGRELENYIQIVR